MSIDVTEKLPREPPRIDPTRDVAGGGQDHLSLLVGLAAVVFSAVYFLSDLIEDAQHRFSNSQLVLTYVAEAAIPLFVIGLYAAQRPRIERLGLVGRSCIRTPSSSPQAR
jgi:hypothetical protein